MLLPGLLPPSPTPSTILRPETTFVSFLQEKNSSPRSSLKSSLPLFTGKQKLPTSLRPLLTPSISELVDLRELVLFVRGTGKEEEFVRSCWVTEEMVLELEKKLGETR